MRDALRRWACDSLGGTKMKCLMDHIVLNMEDDDENDRLLFRSAYAPG